MLRYTISTVEQPLYIIDIYNDGTGTKEYGNYGLTLRLGNKESIYSERRVAVEFPRLRKDAWDLLKLSLLRILTKVNRYPLLLTQTLYIECDLISAISKDNNKSLGRLNLSTGEWSKPSRRKNIKPIEISHNADLVSYLYKVMVEYKSRGRLTD